MSNVDKGQLFQRRCRTALERALGRQFEVEVSLRVPDRKAHAFDLATRERDVVAECKAFSWTVSGNVPSAKLAHLREDVENLRALGEGVARYLILDEARRSGREETLARYFVRLNEELLGPVNVLELSENGLLSCLYGVPPGALPMEHAVLGHRPPLSGAAQASSRPVREEGLPLSGGELNSLRTNLLRLLDWLEEKRGRADETLAARVSRLYHAGVLPRYVTVLMHVVRELRNATEYDNWTPTHNATAVVRQAWAEIREWAEQRGWRGAG